MIQLIVADDPEPTPEELARESWARKHPRCDDCGQFLKKRKPRPPSEFSFGREESEWIGHHFQDYWGEWDHI